MTPDKKLLNLYCMCNFKELLILWLHILNYKYCDIAECIFTTEGYIKQVFTRIRVKAKRI